MELDLDLKKRYTFSDFITWTDGKIRELVDGFIHMFPTPTFTHQRISGRLYAWLGYQMFIKGDCGCELFAAPFTVRFIEDGENPSFSKYVFQPDLCIICDTSKIVENGCIGAPDLIIEIQSPSTSKYDLNHKFSTYERFGVKEYWVVYPGDSSVIVFILNEGKYPDEGLLYELSRTAAIPVGILPGCEIELKNIFP
jgi:Uma2 family endonuclease